MMSSGKPRPENAELERRVKRRPHRLQRKRWPPSCVVPSFVTISELQRGQGIDASSWHQTTHPTPLQENHAQCHRRQTSASKSPSSWSRKRTHPATPPMYDGEGGSLSRGFSSREMNFET